MTGATDFIWCERVVCSTEPTTSDPYDDYYAISSEFRKGALNIYRCKIQCWHQRDDHGKLK